MARYSSSIESQLPPEAAFAYLADFANARFWDPSVGKARRSDSGELGVGSTFELVARFGGRDVELTYGIDDFEPPRRVVLEARRPSFVSRDTIRVEASGPGCRVRYDAVLSFRGPLSLLDPLLQRVFSRIGRRATRGLTAALNP